MKRTILISLMMVLCSAPLAMAFTTFTFAGLEDSQDNVAISALLTGVYGSPIHVEDSEIRDNDDGDLPIWEGKGGWDNFLRVNTTFSNDMEIYFQEKPIIAAWGDGYAFVTDAVKEADFRVTGYGINFGDIENPQNEIGSKGVWTGSGHDAPFSIEFDKPVYLLVFSGLGVDETVGIDNLSVQAIPVPGAFALSGIGLGLVRLLRRRRMLS